MCTQNLVKNFLKGGRVMAVCVFTMAAGRHLEFSQKWNLKIFLFLGCLVLSLNQILCKCMHLWLELWLLKWIFKLAASTILDFVGSEIWCQGRSWRTRISAHQIWWRYLKRQSRTANGRWIDDRSDIRSDPIPIYRDRCRVRISNKIGVFSSDEEFQDIAEGNLLTGYRVPCRCLHFASYRSSAM